MYLFCEISDLYHRLFYTVYLFGVNRLTNFFLRSVTMGFSYVIEHMEEDDESSKVVPPWVELEYAHMRKLAGSHSQVNFTHLSKTSTRSLTEKFESLDDSGKENAPAFCHEAGVLDLIKERLGGTLGKVCLLDPKAEKELSPEDGDGRFEWFLFGGILGDDPPRDRTSELRAMGFPGRHLGPTQMTTDTALGSPSALLRIKVVSLDQIPYIDHPTITFNTKESVEMPFSWISEYIAENDQPLLPPGMRQLLYEDMNKGGGTVYALYPNNECSGTNNCIIPDNLEYHNSEEMASTIPSQTKSSAEDDDDARPYIVVNEIGKGSFATVFKGYHQESHKQVAIKTVKRDKLTTKLFENLQSEIQILKLLSHRHITRLIDIVQSQRNIYLVMEYCSGGDLTNYMKKRGRVETLEYIPSPGAAPQYYPHPRTGGLDETCIRSFLRQLARALKFLRQRQLIHRDIKPQNLLLNPAHQKIADFGFARSLPKTMMAETLCGSPLYMAPEILAYKKYGPEVDLWSNHIELLKKIEHSKGIKFPDEDPTSSAAKSGGGGSQALPVPNDIKKLIRLLLKQRPLERATFDQFFGSTAVAKSKFPKPREDVDGELSQVTPTLSGATSAEGSRYNGTDQEQTTTWSGRPVTPEAHKVIPPEVLDEKAMIPPSRFNFRRTSTLGEPGSTPPTTESPLPKEGPSQPTLKSRQSSTSSNPAARPRMPSRPLSIESSVIPGESEEDGLLRKEYVLVGDTRAVEFNRAVDELDSVPRRPLQDRPVPPSPSIDEYTPSDFTQPTPTFPPPPNMNPVPPLSSSPSSIASRAASNALNRAISLASKTLFGAGHAPPQRKTSSSKVPPRSLSSPSSPRRPHILSLETEGERDPLEDELLRLLEELAQKTEVLTHWADEMYDFVKAVPQKPLPDPNKFAKREGEADKIAKKRKHADMEAEYNAVTCVAVYMLLMSFCQKGIDKLRNYKEHMNMRFPDGNFVVSEGFDDALSWYRDRFIKCNDRAALVKTWLPAQYDGPKSWLDQLVYDRALLLSRTAARKELRDEANAPDECEKLYEESLWCLYALQDDLLQAGNPFMKEDQETIATWIKRTKLRLFRCRARMGMNDGDRMKDARADQNLVDVARIPPAWDGKPSEKTQNIGPHPSS
ncbi:hypothetical protein D9757_012058 [Collybiopsis confluens]|uniref:non-specific serine/threonine protein kinase n=1 Tax=Collybiopsis confluens TaxID=2823264 RepID=A0A8H5D0L7_9AGAR|nr:hypothetical protein D9757_012058 [Collybiopsis confluens]